MTSMVLLLDVGNSRVKWALADPVEWHVDGAAALGESAQILREWDRFPAPAQVIASNVAGDAPAAIFSAYWRERNVPLQWIRASQFSSGVRNLYERPEQLGSDRWAALAGAWSRVRRACLVVSAGTAVTVDALNDSGEFLGGLILPGRRLMQQSLAAGTHALEECSGAAVPFPRNTADAIASGIATALSAAVEASFRRLANASSSTPACILTGGDADWMEKQLQIGAIIAPRLVLEGLWIMTQGDR